MKREYYSDELKQLINQKPKWIVRYGISMIAIIAFVMALLIGFRFNVYKDYLFNHYMVH